MSNSTVLKEQPIIEVDQTEVKKALKQLSIKGSNKDRQYMLQLLYDKHAEYNEQYFFGALSHPLITIDKMNNKTLGCYYHGEDGDAMGIKNHIGMNVNFVALNTEERILETLRHEMVHQWQDEVAYLPKSGNQSIQNYKAWVEDGDRFTVGEAPQKPRPKDWHNKDFKFMAKVCDFPAIGDVCYGNPAKMPTPKSYNRKYQCECISTNGHPVSIWSTRPINATCNVCGKVYKERMKNGELIEVKQSHVENPKGDVIEQEMKKKYDSFKKFTSKKARDLFVEKLEEDENTSFETGIYQTGHNAYNQGYTHWVAFFEYGIELEPEEKTPAPLPEPEPEEEPPAPEPPIVEPPSEVETEPKKRGRGRPKKTPSEVESSDKPKVKKQPKEKEPVDLSGKTYSYKNQDDLIELYKKFGSIKAVGDYFGKSTGAVMYQLKGIDLKAIKGAVKNGD